METNIEKEKKNKKMKIKKKNKISASKARKGKKLFLAAAITSTVLIVSTYAWFVGINKVDVNPFEIEVKTSDGIKLSLDGSNWTSNGGTLLVNKGIITGALSIDGTDSADSRLTDLYTSAAGNKNHWASAVSDTGINSDGGLFPVSTIGKLCKNAETDGQRCNVTSYHDDSNLIQFFDKSSISAVNGGYKILAKENTTKNEYIAFDLFVKNDASNVYTNVFSSNDAEPLFLTKDSEVVYDVSGSNADGAGIVNSMRVAFYNIAQADKNSNYSVFQGLSCTTAPSSGGICDSSSSNRGKTWNIWEPNDTAHTQITLNRFAGTCLKRFAASGDGHVAGDVTSDGCDSLSNGNYSQTFAIKSDISSNVNPTVNIYDGLNGYQSDDYLSNVVTLRQSSNNDGNDDDRESLFYISPASVSKIRIYIWIEGQDVDNFDLSRIYNNVKIKFGFTKDQYDIADLNQSPSPSLSPSPSPTGN